MSDRTLLYAAAFARALATGMIGILLAVHLARLGFDAAAIGIVVSAGLAGAAVATLFVTLRGDRRGRRRLLVALALLGAAGTAGVAAASGAWAIAAAAFLGMVNGMGRDRGAALALEQAMLPATTGDAGRTRAIAVYNVVQDAGHALGSLLAALPALLRAAGVDDAAAMRTALAACAALLAATVALYARLSPAAEPPPGEKPALTPASRRILWRISALFGLDSLAGGLLTTALLAYFFFARFGVAETAIGLLFFGARILNALSHLGAAWLAARVGLVNTMVFTHVPSSLLLATVPFAPNFAVAAALFLLREGLVEMDVPTRQSYVLAVVRPEERAFASGATHLVRMGAWAVGPSIAGALMSGVALAVPLWVGAGAKIVYDGLLYGAFRRVRPPEEERSAEGGAGQR